MQVQPMLVTLDKKLYKTYLDSFEKIVNCNGCGKCCKPGAKDAYFDSKLKAWPALDIVKEENGSVILAPRLLGMRKESNGFACENLKASKCKNYAERPFDCRIFPLSIGIDGEITFNSEFVRRKYCEAKINQKELEKANEKVHKLILEKTKQ